MQPRLVIGLIAGGLFGAGLVLSGMANPTKVLAFLDLAAIAQGGWDPSLAFVMAGALIVTVPGFALLRRRAKPMAAERFHLPTARAIDRRLLVGSAIFGVGWGLAGICPGPAVTLLVLGGAHGWIFFAALLAGMFLFEKLSNRPETK
jgi:uncharacterized membrane protein YedE/YeeE